MQQQPTPENATAPENEAGHMPGKRAALSEKELDRVSAGRLPGRIKTPDLSLPR